jgi:molybdopterin-containing oxidoreductase family iron-sulfur binding subunit
MTKSLDLALIRQRLAVASGSEYWRTLEELSEAESFHEFLHREFPPRASEWEDPVGRRRFLQLMGASLALAGFGACTRQPVETIVPYVSQPEEIVPGKPLFFATAMTLGGIATGLLIESHEGRPIKVEGNPEHPASLGATDVFSQASVLSLYDPDRSQTLTFQGDIKPWPAFLGAIRAALAAQPEQRGGGLRILTETVTSPTLSYHLQRFLAAFPAAKWHQYEPAGNSNARAGARLAFEEEASTNYRFDQAEVILALDSDFLTSGPGALRYARDFADKRRVHKERSEMNRLYAVESTPTSTGATADHRLPLRPGEMEAFAWVLAQELGMLGAGNIPTETAGLRFPMLDPGSSEKLSSWIRAVALDLRRHRGKSIVIAGDEQSPRLHALVHAMNQALGNVGNTVIYTDPPEANPVDQTESLRDLVRDMDSGVAELVLILGGNPVYTAPADLRFDERLRKVKLSVHLSLYDDETSELCHWHIPEAHFLESWGDARAFDGTVTLTQPLIAPLYRGKTAFEVLAAFTDQPERPAYDSLRDYWKGRPESALASGSGEGSPSSRTRDDSSPQRSAEDFEKFWRRALHEGFIPNTAFPEKALSLKWASGVLAQWSHVVAPPPSTKPMLELSFRPDPSIFDGRFANNGWLQELPKPITKLTWDNVALVSPATAERLGLGRGIEGSGEDPILTDVVELKSEGRTVRAPIWILPGQADDCITVHLGYGRTRAGRVGTGMGFNAYALRSSSSPWFVSGLEIQKTGERYPLACTQLHHNLKGRDLLRSETLEEYRKEPGEIERNAHKDHSLYPQHEYNGHAWGMAIDLNSCIGCNACVVACQAENNIPVVGKTEVARGHEMHWLRIDSYHKGKLENPETYFQPVLCMHCENAPCEVVCPVGATVHSSEGLNDMVYNRCVGTRYCSNNCPYKVRRFNFLLYSDWNTPSLKLMRNPDVTVRSRGVMEKCTYCVQRINSAKITAEKQDREIRDGEIVTACQAVCPAQAIVFGDINDSNSRVSKLKAEARNYGLLSELNTRPRTTYLSALRNPNPEVVKLEG